MIFRNEADVERLLCDLAARGVSVDGDASVMLAALQAFENARVGERLAVGRAAKRARDEFCGGGVKYGFRRCGDALEPNDSEQEVIRAVTEMSGARSLRGICERLNYLGYRNRSGTHWHPMQVRRILTQRENSHVDR